MSDKDKEILKRIERVFQHYDHCCFKVNDLEQQIKRYDEMLSNGAICSIPTDKEASGNGFAKDSKHARLIMEQDTLVIDKRKADNEKVQAYFEMGKYLDILSDSDQRIIKAKWLRDRTIEGIAKDMDYAVSSIQYRIDKIYVELVTFVKFTENSVI